MTKKIAETGASLMAVSASRTPPNPQRMIMALRQIGYSFEQAISDLIDNCLNAKASSVLIRFIREGDKIRSIVIADDGSGMSETDLSEAMRFGSEQEQDSQSLGKYGMGLKLASLSHAKCLTVVTRQNAIVHARRWTIKGIESNWACEVIRQKDAEEQIDSPWGGLNLVKNGTLVVWDDIDKLLTSKSGIEHTLRALQKRLQIHLGLCFHRFLEDGRLELLLDQQEYGAEEHGIRVSVRALNPFKYRVSGHPSFPKTFRANIQDIGPIRVEAHIWPPNSDLVEYKLGGQAAAHQGFYFYRNDRLIQAGGWNGIVQHETEPHSSLARVRIDLPTKYDFAFGLNVQKSAVVVPTGFQTGVLSAISDDGDGFEDFRRAAQQVYRKKDNRAQRLIPFVPGEGVPKAITSRAKELTVGARGQVRKIEFVWSEFDSGELFDIDRDSNTIYLNRAFRKRLLGGLRASNVDLPLFKTMLFLLLQKDLDRQKLSKKRKEELSMVNNLLLEAAKLGKG